MSWLSPLRAARVRRRTGHPDPPRHIFPVHRASDILWVDRHLSRRGRYEEEPLSRPLPRHPRRRSLEVR